jgi:hypothetical protein
MWAWPALALVAGWVVGNGLLSAGCDAIVHVLSSDQDKEI